MEEIKNLAFKLNVAVGIPGLNLPSPTQDKVDECANALYDYTISHIDELLAANNSDAYHIGMAFSHIVERPPYVLNSETDDENTKFNLSLRFAFICLWRSLQMKTMQSVIAAHRLIYLIDSLKDSHFEIVFIKLAGYLLDEIFSIAPNEIKRQTETIYKCVKYYLIQITRQEKAFEDTNIEACTKGEKYLQVMHDEYCEDLQGFGLFGIIKA